MAQTGFALLEVTRLIAGSHQYRQYLRIALLLLYDMSAEEAVNSPRFHHQLLPKDTIRMHDGFTEATVNELKAMGYTIDNRRFGDVHLIKRTKEGVEAASEKSGRGKSLVQPY